MLRSIKETHTHTLLHVASLPRLHVPFHFNACIPPVIAAPRSNPIVRPSVHALAHALCSIQERQSPAIVPLRQNIQHLEPYIRIWFPSRKSTHRQPIEISKLVRSQYFQRRLQTRHHDTPVLSGQYKLVVAVGQVHRPQARQLAQRAMNQRGVRGTICRRSKMDRTSCAQLCISALCEEVVAEEVVRFDPA
jgi:hypothetical protein